MCNRIKISTFYTKFSIQYYNANFYKRVFLEVVILGFFKYLGFV